MSMFRGLFVATLVLGLAPTAFAATTATQIIHVSLQGEADQPMLVKLDQTIVKAGQVSFDVVNDAIGTDHEVVLIELKSIDQKINADPKKHRVNESELKSLGEVGGLKPGDKGQLNVSLKPGVSYALICNHKAHYELGMATRFTVVK